MSEEGRQGGGTMRIEDEEGAGIFFCHCLLFSAAFFPPRLDRIYFVLVVMDGEKCEAGRGD